jgi:hypothetical protein
MMADLLLDTGFWALVAGSAFALILVFSVIGAVLEPRIKPVQNKTAGKIMLMVMLGLCIVLALSVVPLMVGTVLGFQEVIGNRGVPAVGFALDHQVQIVLAFWLFMIGGALIAIPAMLHDMERGRL